jgi:hypothetical protein
MTARPSAASLPLRGAVAGLALAAGTIVLVVAGHRHYPIQHWLFWRYLADWVVCVLWATACSSLGRLILRGFRLDRMPFFERELIGFACGVLGFFLGVFAAGMVGALDTWFAVAWPLVPFVAGGRPTLTVLRRSVTKLLRRRPRYGELVAIAFGFAGLGMIYFTILTPANLGFDTLWYHMPIAEHFAVAHRITRFDEGWYLGAYPHLASVIDAWAFCLPFTEPFDRAEIVQHLELVFFLGTLASIPLMVRRLVRVSVPRGTWGAMFLFPSVFLYDGGLAGAADHVAAFFAIPVYLSLRRAEREPSVRRCVVLALALSGALLTKYQAVYYLVPAAAILGGAALLRRSRGVPSMAGPSVALAVGLVLTAPHWLANWIWYGDPLYPMLHAHLADRPFTAHAAAALDTFLGTDLWRPQGSFGQKLGDTLRAVFMFSFEPHDWPTYHGKVPVFGSLFTIASLVALGLTRARAIRQAILMILTGVAIWFLTSHQDRYLQCLLPWMVSVTVAIGLEVWHQLPALRGWMTLPVALQIIWAGDVYFIPSNDDSYEVDRPSPVKAAVDLIASGYRGDYVARLHPFAEWEQVGASLPPRAKVLLHERYLHYGIGRTTVSDLTGWQGGISYEEAPSLSQVYELLKGMGVTHVLWETDTSHEQNSLAADAAFFRFVKRATLHPQSVGRFTIAEMPSEPPRADAAPTIASHDCTKAAPPPDDADVLVTARECGDPRITKHFELGAFRGASALWLREPDAPARRTTASGPQP